MSFSGLDRDQLIRWLEETLVPVEPRARFVHHLRARLVRVRGGLMGSAWPLVVAAAATLLILMASLGLILRFLLGLLGALGLLERGRRRSSAA